MRLKKNWWRRMQPMEAVRFGVRQGRQTGTPYHLQPATDVRRLSAVDHSRDDAFIGCLFADHKCGDRIPSLQLHSSLLYCFSPPCRACDFLLLAQKKVTKEKGTRVSGGCAVPSPARRAAGGTRTRAAHSDSVCRYSAALAARLSRSRWGLPPQTPLHCEERSDEAIQKNSGLACPTSDRLADLSAYDWRRNSEWPVQNFVGGFASAYLPGIDTIAYWFSIPNAVPATTRRCAYPRGHAPCGIRSSRAPFLP